MNRDQILNNEGEIKTLLRRSEQRAVGILVAAVCMKGSHAPFLVTTDVGKKKVLEVGKKKALEVGKVPDMLDTHA